jgi:hypothetical protein
MEDDNLEKSFLSSYKSYSSQPTVKSSFFNLGSMVPTSSDRPLLPVTVQDLNVFSREELSWIDTCGFTRFQVT